jgi:hypothetical protein
LVITNLLLTDISDCNKNHNSKPTFEQYGATQIFLFTFPKSLLWLEINQLPKISNETVTIAVAISHHRASILT